MEDLITILPLAVVMVAGPQMISAIFLATTEDWARTTAAFVLGAAVSISIVVTIAFLVTDTARPTDEGASTGSEGQTLDVIILVLLLALAVQVFRRRDQSEPPKWMGRLQGATPRFALVLGFLLLGVFPTDIITSVTVGTRLAREGAPLTDAIGFVALTLLLLALPALLVVATGERAKRILPKVRRWMNDHAWIVNELVIALFVVLQISSLAEG